MHISADIQRLASLGAHFAGAMDMLTPEVAAQLATDATPTIVTSANSGIPSYLNTYVDPKLIDVLFAPNKAAIIVGEEVQKGDWVTPTAVFPQVENSGEVSVYGDFNQNGSTGANITFPQRQQLVYQTMVIYGDQQADRAAQARVNWANTLKQSAAIVLNKFQNTTYFSGVSGIQCYGLLNDPSLTAALTPGTKAAGGTTWNAATGQEIYNDVLSLFKQLQVQMQGLIEMDDKMVLALDPQTAVNLLKNYALGGASSSTVLAENVGEIIKKAFPKLRIETAVQYLSTGSGNFIQLIAEEVEGQRTAVCGYSEKMRAHAIVRETSSWHQKMSQGTWGTIIFRPLGISSMIGI